MTEDKYYYDHVAAQIVVNFCEKLIVHIKGEWAGMPFKLEEWQEKIVRDVFGWKRKSDGTRRYRQVFIALPRKQGKSFFASAIALYMLIADGEPGAEIYSVASDRSQAGIVFEVAKKMVVESPYLKEEVKVYRNALLYNDTNSSYRVLSSDAPRQHGWNAHAVFFDEVHTQPNRELYDVLSTSMGARRQPLMFMTTTAGYDTETICYELWDKADKILRGVEVDDSFYPVIFAADPEDDWTDEETWKKANPNYGVSVKPEFLRDECKKAKQTPGYQNAFKRLYLNLWTAQETRFIDMSAWDACQVEFDENLLKGSVCYGGLDLASTSDLASLNLVFPNEHGEEEMYTTLPFFWLPEDGLYQRGLSDRVDYSLWKQQGLLRTTPGNAIDFDFILRDIEALYEIYKIKEIAFDRWGAFQVSQTLERMGITMIGFGQGYASMSAPTSDLNRLILSKRIRHNGHRVLRWNVDNLIVTTDDAGNMKPSKSKARNKIDGAVALIMALDRAIRNNQGNKMSVYEERGLMFV